ncbi:MAG: thiamine pyrophosphate-binding protein [Candidatus Bathyarchaeota archaeon]|nr:thiamine pyrophosphate-binding protein [Candidatus Bathyarchaeum sp.]
MNHEHFCQLLKTRGFDFYTGVPCSILSSIIKYMSEDNVFSYVSATREDEAIGLAVGAYMAGKQPVVLMQNSGLGQSVNALTSLALLYKIPMLLLISWRGFEGKDAPEHLYMGKCMMNFLDIMKIPAEIAETTRLTEQLNQLSKKMCKQKTPVALILKKGVIT